MRMDRGTKLPLYALAGIPEVWIVELRRRRILVYRSPRDGGYTETFTVERDGSVSPLAFPDIALEAGPLFV